MASLTLSFCFCSFFLLLVRDHDICCPLGIMVEADYRDGSQSIYSSPVCLGYCFHGEVGGGGAHVFDLRRICDYGGSGAVRIQDRIIKSVTAVTWVSWDVWFWNPASRLGGTSSSLMEMLPLVCRWTASAELGGSGLALAHGCWVTFSLPCSGRSVGAETRHFHCDLYKILTHKNCKR